MRRKIMRRKIRHRKTVLHRALLALLVLVLVLAASAASAQRGDDSDRPSKNGKLEGAVGGVDVTIEYGRPKVGGRDIWGALVPYGLVWRTGANEATTITLSKDAKIEGQALPAGTYSFFAIPNESEWTLIFNKVAQQWGAFSYDQSQDALRVTVKPMASEAQEELEYRIDGDKVVLHWEKLAVPFSISG